MTDAARFAWTCHATGSWSANGYAIKRDRVGDTWRILRDGIYWDSLPKLPDAKRACERDHARRLKRSA
jgi:hypothetical protein